MIKFQKKIFIRILKWGLAVLAAFVFVLIILLSLDSQKVDSSLLKPPSTIVPIKEYSKSQDSLRYDSLLVEFGKNKVLPKGFEIQALLALSYYPQLKEVAIEFQFTDSQSSLYSQIDISSLLNPSSNRVYVILIDTVKVVDYVKPTLLENLPYNGQIGVLGHELAHTISYLDKSGLDLLWIAFKYQTSRDYVVPFENSTDARSIKFGLGYQLLHWSEFQYGIKVKEGKGDMYFSPERVLLEMEKYPFYEPVN